MAPHFVLYEHAAGYALFKLQEFEEVATFLPQVEESVTDVSKFSQVKTLVLCSQVTPPLMVIIAGCQLDWLLSLQDCRRCLGKHQLCE